ncbi:hypothetical protein D0Y65_002522, partial [Glycine soja]
DILRRGVVLRRVVAAGLILDVQYAKNMEWLLVVTCEEERFQRPSLDKKQNAPSPTALSSAGDFHEMKTGGIVVCSTLVALVYIPEYSYGRSVTQPTQKSKGLTPSRLENDPYGMA